MTKDEIQSRIAELRGLIEKANRDYYDLHQPTVGDRDYDMWEAELLRLEKENPEFATDDSPVRNVAGGVSEGFAKVTHEPPMQSLDKTHSKDELADFDAMVRSLLASEAAAESGPRSGGETPPPRKDAASWGETPPPRKDAASWGETPPPRKDAASWGETPPPRKDAASWGGAVSAAQEERSCFTYLVEPKVDGVSLSLRYENGILVRAATRGNGRVGDDITANARTIRTIPQVLPVTAPKTLEVRGEAYMTREGFVELNRRQAAAGLEEFANPRNACAGSLKQLDAKVTAERPLDVVIYNAGGVGCDGFASHSEMIAAFREWGFPVAPWSKSCKTMDEVFAAIDELQEKRHSFRFEIDGAVIKIDERKFYDILGATAHGPRWARAYKYAPERAETVVESITVQVGRTGILTPVAELKPTELAGSVISRATLHNADQIARQDIRIGDHVWLVKAGDVIPAIDSVIPEKRTGEETVFEMPRTCPVCGGEVVREEGEVAMRCVNPTCPAQLSRRIEHFASRNALDIRALGETVVDALVEQKLVSDPLDLFSLRAVDLYALEISGHRFGKNSLTVMDALAAAKSLPLHRWLYAMGIPNVGVTVAKDVAAEHGKMSDLVDSAVLNNVVANDEKKGKDRQILQIKVEAAKAVLGFFAGEYGKRFLARMAELGIDPVSEKPAEVKTEGPLVGMGCVLTGTLSRPRGEYAKLIEAAGGIVQSAVTSKTRYLIAGENTGATKTEKARKLGTEVIDEAKLRELLGV